MIDTLLSQREKRKPFTNIYPRIYTRKIKTANSRNGRGNRPEPSRQVGNLFSDEGKPIAVAGIE